MFIFAWYNENRKWGKLRFDFENGTAEITKLADWDTMKSNIFAKTAILIPGFGWWQLILFVAICYAVGQISYKL